MYDYYYYHYQYYYCYYYCFNRTEDIKGPQDLKMGHAAQARPR